MSTRQVVIAAFCSLLHSSVQAQAASDIGLMGRVTWSAFECASLASVMNDEKEQERLFRLGYQQGTAFIRAFETRKAERKDMLKEVPVGFAWRLEGPTADFILGRVFESAQEEALKGVFRVGDQEGRSLLAQNRYVERNCALLRAIQ